MFLTLVLRSKSCFEGHLKLLCITRLTVSAHFSSGRCLGAKPRQTEMVRVLNVAEKNDAAKNITELMSKGKYRRRDGRSVYNKIYEFEYTVFGERCAMTMTSVSGHLLNLEFSGAYRKWQGCNPVSLFDAPVTFFCPDDYEGIKKTLEQEVRNCKHLIIWTDCDREGENIGFEIINVCKNVKSGILVHRAKFSEITTHAVTRAIHNLCPPDQRLNDAVNVRRELDLRIGAAFTRFQTMRLRRVFPDVLSDQLISYGSCQFPTLGFVVDRYKQVQAFIPEQFWKLKVTHVKEEKKTEFSWKRNRLFDHTACLVLYQICLENPTARVTDIKSRPKSKWRPQPLDTVELEKIASRKLHINAKQALNIAEKLYTQGYISYPRTETTIFPKELDLAPLVEMQSRDNNWGAFARRVMEDGPNPRQGSKTDNAHPPIHPIKYTSTLQGNEKAIYDFVVRRFLACLSKDAEGRETVVEIDVNSEKFAVSGLMIIARNYLEVYPYEKWNAKEIAEYNLGEEFQPNSIEMGESETNAPELLTEADLIALMEKHGIGTDATHSDHIETIKSRRYVGVNENGRFVPGELGMGLVEGYDMMGFQMSKPHLRSGLEADLKRICDGTKDPKVVLREQVAKYKEYFIEAVRQAIKIDDALSNYFQTAPGQVQEEAYDNPSMPVMKCPRCSGDIVLKTKRDNRGFYLSCMSYPQCTAAMWLPDCIEQVQVTDEVCHQCRPGPVQKLKFKVKRGALQPFYEDEFITCIGGCDRDIMEVMNVRPLTSGAPSNQSSNSVVLQSSNNSSSRRRTSESGYGSNTSSTFQSNQSSSQNSVAKRITTSRENRTPTTSTTQFRQPFSTCPTFSRQPLVGPVNSSQPVSGNGAGASDIVCHCGNSAILLTVRKDGPNKGKQFYKCSGPPDKRCQFFLWEEGNGPAVPVPNNRNFSPVNGPLPVNGLHDDDEIVCQCGKPAIILTVRKEGPTKGKQFYKCGEVAENRCQFFLWKDDDAVSPQDNSSDFRPHPQDAAEPHCNCSCPARLLTVQKEGQNKGRRFYTCPKPRKDSCQFFQWEDNSGTQQHDPSNSVHGALNQNNQSRRRRNSSDGGAPPKRKCGLCSEIGHNRRNCPLNSS